MKKLFNALIAPLLIFAVVFTSALTSACDRNQIEQAARASYQMSGLTLDAVRATKQAYESGAITLEQKDAIAEKLSVLSRGGQTFNAAVRRLHETYRDGQAPPDQIEVINKLFDESVVAPFLAVLTQTGAIKNAPQIQTAIALIRASVLTISASLGKRSRTLSLIEQEPEKKTARLNSSRRTAAAV